MSLSPSLTLLNSDLPAELSSEATIQAGLLRQTNTLTSVTSKCGADQLGVTPLVLRPPNLARQKERTAQGVKLDRSHLRYSLYSLSLRSSLSHCSHSFTQPTYFNPRRFYLVVLLYGQKTFRKEEIVYTNVANSFVINPSIHLTGQ